MKKILLALMLQCSSAMAMINEPIATIDYEQALVVTHPGIGPCDFSYDGEDFFIHKDGDVSCVQRCFVDKHLRKIDSDKLLQFLVGGYLYVNQLDNGEFTITAKGRLNGGFIGFLIAAFSVADFVINTAIPAASIMSQGNTITVTAHRVDNVGPVRAGDPSRVGSSQPVRKRPDRPRETWAQRPQEPPRTGRMPERLDVNQTGRIPLQIKDRPNITPIKTINPLDLIR